jgi:hypothetical protein
MTTPNLKFIFPPIFGIYDTGDGTIYIFGSYHEDEVEDVINHELLHWVIHKLEGKEACLALDNLCPEATRSISY